MTLLHVGTALEMGKPSGSAAGSETQPVMSPELSVVDVTVLLALFRDAWRVGRLSTDAFNAVAEPLLRARQVLQQGG